MSMEKQYWKRSFIVLSLLALIAGNAYGATKYGYAEVVARPTSPTEIGEVSVGTSNSSSTSAKIEFQGDAGFFGSEYKTSFRVTAKILKDGWYFAGWSKDDNVNITNFTSTDKDTELSFSATGSKIFGKISRNTDTYYAIFKPVTVSGPSTFEVNPTELQKTYSGTIIFSTVGADNMADFTYGSANNTSSDDGIWNFGEPVLNGNTVTVEYTYRATRNTYKNSLGARTDQATYTLTSKGDAAQTVTCTLTATFPSLAIQAGTAQNLNLVNTSSTASGVATFPVSFADAKSNFRAPVFASTAGAAESAWTVTQWDYANNLVTVHYTFRGDGANRNNSATLTLISADGNASNNCTVTATVPASQVLSATAENLSPVLPETEYRGTAVFEVQYAATHTVSFGTQQGAGTWKVLNSVYKVTDEAAGKGTVTVNYSYTTAADFAVRQNSNTLTLTLDGGAVSRSCAITANVPDAAVLSATVENLSPVLPSTEYRGTAVFEVQYVDAHAVSFGTQQGAGTWKVLSSTYRITDAATGKGTVTVEYSYTTAADFAVRQNSNTLTLTLDGGIPKSCIITANFPSLAMSVQSNDVLVMTLPEQTQAGKVVFAVTYANGAADFVLPTATDSRWSITDMQYASLSPSSGTLTVNYTFDNGGVEGDWTTDLTLQTKSGATCVATLRAIAERESDKDAAVTTPAGETTEYEKWADALLAANSEDGCTLRLLRNVALETLAANQEIKRNMTLDLNGKTLSAALTSTYYRLLYLNTEGVTLTVKDGRSGGTLKAQGNVANALYAVQVNKGNLIWESGNIEITNTTGTGNNWNHATGIYLANGTGLTMTGGTITSRHTLAAYAGGIYADAGAEVTATGVTIDVQAHSNAYGIYANAAVSAEGVAAYARLSLTDNTVAVTTLTTAGAYGVYLNAVQKQITTGDYIGEYAAASNAVITGGKFTATAKTSTAYGIYAVAPVVTANGNAYASSELTVTDAEIVARTLGTITAYGIQGSGATTVERCRITAEAKTITASGIFLQDKTAKITDCEITATGTATVYGIYANASVLNGHTLYVDLTAENNTVTATATTGSSAFAVYMKQMQSVVASGNFAGSYAASSRATIIGGTYTATAQQHYAFGVANVTDSNYNIEITSDGQAVASENALLEIQGAVIKAKNLDNNHTVCGVAYMGTVKIKDCTIEAESEKSTPRSIMLGAGEAFIHNSTITAKGTSSAYGIYANASVKNGRTCFVNLTAENNTVTATTTTGGSAYGVYLHTAQSTPTSGTFAGNEYAAASKAVITGGTYTATAALNNAYAVYSATCAISDFGGAEAYPVINITGGEFIAEAGTSSAGAVRNGGHLTINGGTFTSNAKGGSAYGIYTIGGKLKATGTTITATNSGTSADYAYGVYSAGNAIKDYIGKTFASDVELNDVTMNVFSGRSWAYGVRMCESFMSLTQAKYDALSDANKAKYKDKYAFGEYVAMGNCVINGGSFDIRAQVNWAFGMVQYDHSDANYVLSPDGAVFTSAKLDIRDAHFTVRAETGNQAHGIKTQTPTWVDNSIVDVYGKTGTVRALWITNGNTTVRNSRLTATGGGAIYGIYTYANANLKNVGWKASGTLILDNLTVTATAEKYTKTDGTPVTAVDGAYGISLASSAAVVQTGTHIGEEYACAYNAVITGGTYTATAARDAAYAVTSAVRAVSECGGAVAYPEITTNGGTFKAVTGTGKTARALNSGGKAIVNGGVFTAQAGSSSAMGFLVSAGTLEATDAVLNISATTSDAYGVYLDANINAICAVPYATQATLNNLQMTVTSGTSNAYGVCGKNGTAIAQTDATFETWCKKKQIMNADGTIKEGYEEIYKIYNAGYKRGEFADMVRSLTVNGGTYNITATAIAHGIFVPNTYVSTNKAVVIPEMSVQDAIVHVKASTGGTVYGIQSGGPTTVTGCDISATAPNGATVRGVFLQNGEATVANSVIVAEGCKNDVYGIYADAVVNGTNGYATFVDLTSDNNTVTATSLHGSNAYGLYLKTASTLIEKGTYIGTESAAASSAVIKAGSYTADANSGAYGIVSYTRAVSACGGAEAWPELIVNGAAVSATTDSLNTAYALQSGGKAIVDGGRFTARTAGTTAYGFYVTAGNLVATGATITATAGKGDAKGIYLTTGIEDICMAPRNTSAELNNLNVTVRTLTGNSAYGIHIYDNGTSKNQTDASFETWCKNTKKIMDADGNITNQALYDIYNAGYKRGEFVEAVRNVIVNGGTYDAVSNGTTAYGVKTMIAPVVSATGKTSAATELTMRNATISATTETGATAYGVYTSGPTTIDNCDISATSATTGARGIHIYDNKTLLTNSTVSVNAAGNDVYGVYAYAQVTPAGWQFKAELESDNTVINAETVTGSGVYAVWLHAHATQATKDDYGRLGNDYAVAASAVLNGGTCKIVAQGDVTTDSNGNINGPVVYGLGFQAEAVKNDASAAPSCIVNGGKYWGESKAENKFADVQSTALRGKLLINDGYFRNSTNVTPYIREGYSLFDLPTTTKEYEEGYRYFIAPASASGTYVCEVVGQQQYKTLEEALQFVNLNPNTAYTIRMLANYTLPAGDYVLPAKATLLIPYKENQTAIGTTAQRTDNNNSNAVPTAYVTLTLASGVNLSVQGIIEASAEQYNAGNPYGRVAATYGHLLLKENTAVTLESGSKLIAWGYVTGKGTIEAKDGATLYEDFSIADWKGGGVSSKMQGNKQKVFPITHYFYQNIEATVVYRPGAVAIGSSSVQTSVATADVDNVYLVGTSDNGNVLFMMDKANASQDTYLKKEYDFVKDITCWTMNNGVTLNSIKISATGVNLESTQYVLPITSNFHITLDYGTVSIMQDTYFMPNTVLTIKKEATLSIPSGHTLYIVDSEQWNALYYGGQTTIGGLLPVYSPSWENPKKRGPWSNNMIDCTKMSDAEIFVHGTIEVAGNFYTTEGGANIHSTNEDAGKVIFRKTEPASTTDKLYLCNTDCGKSGIFSYYWNYETYSLTSAQLKNGNDTYTQTAITNAGESFIYVNDQWIKTVDNGCMSTVTDGAGEHLYIHAGDMVEVLGNGDYAYKDKATGTRYFINTNAAKGQANCVWWEVELKDGGYYMANQEKYDNYGTYYYYDSASDFWKPKTVTVTWKNYDGTTLAVYSDVSYNTSPKYLGATPTRQNTAIAKYAWTGWTDAEGKFYEKNITLPVAFADMTYTAWFTENKYQYTVTFKNHDGSLIESGLWEVGERPVCSVTPQRTPTESLIYTFIGWTTPLQPVTGPAEYIADYSSSLRPYTVTFVNYDGAVLSQEEFLYGTMPAYRGITPVRESNTAYSYTFSGWDKPFEAVKGNITYTAQFTAKEREYGEVLDIVDWTEQGPVLNMNGYTSPSAMAGWTISAEGIDYTKDHRAADRTLQIALSQTYAADAEVLILAKGTDGVVESRRRYKVPHVFDADAVLGAVAADNSSVIFVRAGKLTVTGDATVAAVYVAPGAELCIDAGVTLAAGKLVLRTEAFASAVFTNNGTLLCDNVCYSRIVSDNSQAYPFALPFASDLTKTTYSNGKSATLGVHYGLLTYDAQQRADYGLTMEQGPNWVGLPKDETELKACQGYQLLSASGFYSEYCFPVAYQPTTGDKNVPLLAYKGTTGKTGVSDWGWNTICSPYTQMYEAKTVSPESVVKISVLNPEDNRTWSQTPATEIAPASLFFYQTEAAGTLSFGANLFAFQQAAPHSIVARRAEHNYSSQPTQWIRIFCDTEDGKSDETSIYLHPDKFTIGYQAGYDVVKLSEQGALPFMWSSVPYGNMAFAALPDTVAEQGIPLTVFAPQTEEINLSLIDNQWLSRLEHVYLLDREQQTLTDLLQNDYSYHAIAGTAAGRFVVYPIFRTPGMTDDLTMTDAAASFTAYGVEKNILVSHLPQNVQLACYDLMGRLVYTAFATTDALSIAVPVAGIYFVQAMDEVQKVIVR